MQSTLAIGSAAFTTPGVFADLLETPSQTEGPFYPNHLPLDTDNDLLVINESITPAVGDITHLSGRVLDAKGNPIRNAFVEIWQVDNQAVYLHTGDKTNRANQDTNFQGYGRFLTDREGRYYFRTIKPVPYPGRTPHIHVGVSRGGNRLLTTQLYVKGHPSNAKDGLLNRLDVKAQRQLLGDFKPLAHSKLGELAVDFDIILGTTPDDDERKNLRGVAKPLWKSRG
ncbi:protocatechuate 3,4-dioxygenase [bacterium]|nr:protocatechuate 3,4-dioxygenase [bacterium]